MPGEKGKPHEIVDNEEVQVSRKRKPARKAVMLQADTSEENSRESSVKSRTRQKNIGDGNDQYEGPQMLENNVVKNENSLKSLEIRRSTRVRKQVVPTNEANANTTLGFRIRKKRTLLK